MYMFHNKFTVLKVCCIGAITLSSVMKLGLHARRNLDFGTRRRLITGGVNLFLRSKQSSGDLVDYKYTLSNGQNIESKRNGDDKYHGSTNGETNTSPTNGLPSEESIEDGAVGADTFQAELGVFQSNTTMENSPGDFKSRDSRLIRKGNAGDKDKDTSSAKTDKGGIYGDTRKGKKANKKTKSRKTSPSPTISSYPSYTPTIAPSIAPTTSIAPTGSLRPSVKSSKKKSKQSSMKSKKYKSKIGKGKFKSSKKTFSPSSSLSPTTTMLPSLLPTQSPYPTNMFSSKSKTSKRSSKKKTKSNKSLKSSKLKSERKITKSKKGVQTYSPSPTSASLIPTNVNTLLIVQAPTISKSQPALIPATTSTPTSNTVAAPIATPILTNVPTALIIAAPSPAANIGFDTTQAPVMTQIPTRIVTRIPTKSPLSTLKPTFKVTSRPTTKPSTSNFTVVTALPTSSIIRPPIQIPTNPIETAFPTISIAKTSFIPPSRILTSSPSKNPTNTPVTLSPIRTLPPTRSPIKTADPTSRAPLTTPPVTPSPIRSLSPTGSLIKTTNPTNTVPIRVPSNLPVTVSPILTLFPSRSAIKSADPTSKKPVLAPTSPPVTVSPIATLFPTRSPMKTTGPTSRKPVPVPTNPPVTASPIETLFPSRSPTKTIGPTSRKPLAVPTSPPVTASPIQTLSPTRSPITTVVPTSRKPAAVPTNRPLTTSPKRSLPPSRSKSTTAGPTTSNPTLTPSATKSTFPTALPSILTIVTIIPTGIRPGPSSQPSSVGIINSAPSHQSSPTAPTFQPSMIQPSITPTSLIIAAKPSNFYTISPSPSSSSLTNDGIIPTIFPSMQIVGVPSLSPLSTLTPTPSLSYTSVPNTLPPTFVSSLKSPAPVRKKKTQLPSFYVSSTSNPWPTRTNVPTLYPTGSVSSTPSTAPTLTDKVPTIESQAPSLFDIHSDLPSNSQHPSLQPTRPTQLSAPVSNSINSLESLEINDGNFTDVNPLHNTTKFNRSVSASPFTVTYYIQQTREPTDTEFYEVQDLTMKYLQDLLIREFFARSNVLISNFTSVSMDTNIGGDFPRASFHVSLTIAERSQYVPDKLYVDALIQAAFEDPAMANQLLDLLQSSIPHDNPFSTTIRLSCEKDNQVTIPPTESGGKLSDPILISIVATATLLLLLLIAWVYIRMLKRQRNEAANMPGYGNGYAYLSDNDSRDEYTANHLGLMMGFDLPTASPLSSFNDDDENDYAEDPLSALAKSKRRRTVDETTTTSMPFQIESVSKQHKESSTRRNPTSTRESRHRTKDTSDIPFVSSLRNAQLSDMSDDLKYAYDDVGPGEDYVTNNNSDNYYNDSVDGSHYGTGTNNYNNDEDEIVRTFLLKQRVGSNASSDPDEYIPGYSFVDEEDDELESNFSRSYRASTQPSLPNSSTTTRSSRTKQLASSDSIRKRISYV